MTTCTKPLLEVSTLVEGNEVRMRRFDDGAVSLTTNQSEHFIYLYPAQVEVLRAFLDAKL